jgi:hypothetical protein
VQVVMMIICKKIKWQIRRWVDVNEWVVIIIIIIIISCKIKWQIGRWGGRRGGFASAPTYLRIQRLTVLAKSVHHISSIIETRTKSSQILSGRSLICSMLKLLQCLFW